MAKKKENEKQNELVKTSDEEKQVKKKSKTFSLEDVKNEAYKELRKFKKLDYPQCRQQVDYLCGFSTKQGQNLNDKKKHRISAIVNKIRKELNL